MTTPTNLLAEVLADLAAEGELLGSMVAALDANAWRTPTPAAGWDIAHQVAHLAWTDEVAVLAATDKAAWDDVVTGAAADPSGFVDAAADAGARTEPGDLLVRWRAGRRQLQRVLADHPPGERIPWFGPPMSATSMATARFMETWAHGHDIADALRVPVVPTARIRHIVHLGVRTRDFAFTVHGLTPPVGKFRLELVGPDNQPWTYGPVDAAQLVRGPAYDFCLLVTQRRHRADLALTVRGEEADTWLDIAQAFAGPPGEGRAPGAARASGGSA